MNDDQILILRAGREEGPFTRTALAAAVRTGSLSRDTPARRASDLARRPVVDFLSEAPGRSAGGPPPDPARPHAAASPPAASSRPAESQRSLRPWLALAGVLILGSIAVVLPTRVFEPSPSGGGRGEETAERPATSAPGKAAATLREAEQCVLMVKSGESAASAFYARSGGEIFIYTNVHAVQASTPSFEDFRGNRVAVRDGPEVADSDAGAGVDLVRFRPQIPPRIALDFASREKIETKPSIHTLGDSEGRGILASIPGKVTGVGPQKLEVDSGFVQGNSGGPIVTADGEVVAVASFMTMNPSLWAKDTNFEVRRFGWMPGPKLRWEKTSLEQLYEERRLVEETARTSRLLAAIAMADANPDGFGWPANLTVEQDYQFAEILEEANGHPLHSRFFETDQSVEEMNAANKSDRESVRVYRRFFVSCAEYASGELAKARREVRSDFWRQRLDGQIDVHESIIETFENSVAGFVTRGELGKPLIEF